MTRTRYFGARQQRRLLRTRQQSPSISRMPETAQTQESPSVSSTFGYMATSRSTRVTTPFPMSEMARQYRFLRALLWCSGIETESGLSSVTIHPVCRNQVLRAFSGLLTSRERLQCTRSHLLIGGE